jgi:hypothetical protein
MTAPVSRDEALTRLVTAAEPGEATLLASAARTATTNTADQTATGRGVMLVLNVTVEAASETLALKIQGKDPVSGNYFDVASFGTMYTSTGEAPVRTKAGVLYPGVLVADHVGVAAGVDGTIARSGVLPATWRAVVTHSSTGAWTYSLAAVAIP